MKRSGRKSLSQTPAPLKDKIYGSKKNPKGSASSEKSASKIVLSAKVLSALIKKLKEFKDKHRNNKSITLSDLKAVYRRGSGAYSSTHRPTITGGKPNTRNAWAMARVNKFLLKAGGTKVKKAYVQDDDLLKFKDGAIIENETIKVLKSFYDDFSNSEIFDYLGLQDGNYTFNIGDSEFVIYKDSNFTDVEKIKFGRFIQPYFSHTKKPLYSRFFDRYKIVGKNIIIKLKDMYAGGGMTDDNNETYKKWRSLVNMSYSELQKFYDSPEGKKAGLSASEAKKQGIDSGRESARWILKMKSTTKDKWTPAMWKWAKKQISFISRMSGNKGGLYDEKGNKTRKHTSLLIWGHNPKKSSSMNFKDGGLIAPNGKKSNLTPEQYKLVRTPEFKKWFGDWEKDPKNASKVVDENGEPLVVYHSTEEKFNQFDYKTINDSANYYEIIGFYFTSNKPTKRNRYGNITKTCFLNIRNMIFVTDQMTEKNPYWETKKLNKKEILLLIGDKKPVYNEYTKEKIIEILLNTDKLNSQLEFIYREFFSRWQVTDGIRLFLENLTDKLGFDGAYMPHSEYYVAFHPNQIKLADGTNTTFDVNNPDIRYEDGGEVKSFFTWFYNWYKGVYNEMDIMISLPNEISGLKSVDYTEEKVIILDMFRKVDQNINAKSYLQTILDKADEFGITIYLYPDPNYKYIDDAEYRKKISRNYLVEYYERFGFELTPDKEFMKRLPKYANGGATDFSKVISKSSRFRPSETIFFDPPLYGLNGNKLVSYTWSYEWTEDWSKSKGEPVAKRISDWTQAEQSAETGRNIVHKYTIEKKDGTTVTVSSESVPVIMGYVEKTQTVQFSNLATASKTLAKQKLQLSILESQKKEFDDAKNEILSKGYPEVINQGKGSLGIRYTMGDSGVWDMDAKVDDAIDKERLETLKDGYVKSELTKMGFNVYESYGNKIYELKNRIMKQERKIENILKSKMEDGGMKYGNGGKLDVIKEEKRLGVLPIDETHNYLKNKYKSFKKKNAEFDDLPNIYIRAGLPKITKDGTFDASMNYYTRKKEKGVSVFDAKYSPNSDFVFVDFSSSASGSSSDINMAYSLSQFDIEEDGDYEKYDSKMYLLEGERIGYGSDGEYLLNPKTLKVIGILNPNKVVPPKSFLKEYLGFNRYFGGDRFDKYPIYADGGVPDVRMEDTVQRMDDPHFADISYYAKGGQLRVGEEEAQKKIMALSKKYKLPEEYMQVQLTSGINTEMEHTDDTHIATKIALDHLAENPNYYIKLKEMEKQLEKIPLDNYLQRVVHAYANGGEVDMVYSFATPTGKPTKLNYIQQILVRTTQFKGWFGDWESCAKDYLKTNMADFKKSFTNCSIVIDYETLEPMVVYHGTNYKDEFFTFDVTQEEGVGRPYGYFADNREYSENFTSGSQRGQHGLSLLYNCFLNIRKPFFAIDSSYYGVKDTYVGWGLKIPKSIYEDKFGQLKPEDAEKFTKTVEVVMSQIGKYMYNVLGGLTEENPFWVLMARDKNKEFKAFLMSHGYDGVRYAEEFKSVYDIDNPAEFTKAWTIFDANQVKLADGRNIDFDPMNKDIRYEEGGKLHENETERETEGHIMFAEGGHVIGNGSKTNNAKRGGFFKGRSHAEGGIKAVNVDTGQPLEVEGNEVIINKRSVQDSKKRMFDGKMMTNREILSKINVEGGGVAFEDGGEINENSCHCSGKKYKFGGEMMTDYDIVKQLISIKDEIIEPFNPAINYVNNLIQRMNLK